MATFEVESGKEGEVIDKARANDGLEPTEKPKVEDTSDDDVKKDDDASSDSDDDSQDDDSLSIPDKKEDDGDDKSDDDKPKDDDDGDDKPKDDDKVPDAGSLPQEFVGFAKEYIEKGELSDDSRVKIREALFSKFSEDEADAYVDTYLAGLGAIAREQTRASHDLVGGSESYKGMIVWAAENLSEEEVTAFNKSLVTPGSSKLAIKGLHAQYMAAHGGLEPDHSNKGQAAAGGEPPLASRTKLREQMRDPRYKTDKVFREEVMTKLRRSMESGRYVQQ